MAEILASKDGSIGWLTFDNQPRLNAMTFEMWLAMPGLLADFAADPAIRVVVLRGAGEKAFISGADISQFDSKRGSAEAVEAYNDAVGDAGDALLALTKPTLALVQGYCIGGGLATALNCDIRIAADNARFAIPAGKLGLGYAYPGIKRLVDIVGPAFAKEIFYTARQFDAAEAAAMGLINRVVPVADLEREVRDLAERIAGNAPLTLRAVKMAVDAACEDASGQDLTPVERAVAACFVSEDYKEGRRAFAEKRRPQFLGK